MLARARLMVVRIAAVRAVELTREVRRHAVMDVFSASVTDGHLPVVAGPRVGFGVAAALRTVNRSPAEFVNTRAPDWCSHPRGAGASPGW
ncbi:hypothetical protein KCMC57_up14100 [Kitasatospora sp. CMC57]|uniref:Uncharacterized protein n=1 Tax=Kitasatospora sp. CMC57 TaxID=3231513 RepID=A0AB33JZC5_9ACTN